MPEDRTITAVERPLLGSRYEFMRDNWNIALTPRQIEACRDVQALIDLNDLELESVPCLCGARDGELIASRDWFGFFYPLRLCGTCGVLWQSERFKAKSLQRFYSDWYRKVYDARPDVEIEAEWQAAVERGNRRYSAISQMVRLASGSIVADIGCNFGTLLTRFQAEGMQTWGCDFGEEHLHFGRERLGTSSLLHGDAERLVDAGVRAQLVTMDHVFEHFADPLAELTRIRSILAPGGRVFVSVPGTWWWTRNVCSGDLLSLLQNAHTYQFDLDSLCDTFGKAGFVLESSTEEIAAVFRPAYPSESTNSGVKPTAGYVRRGLLALERRRKVRYAVRIALRAVGLENAARKLLARSSQGSQATNFG